MSFQQEREDSWDNEEEPVTLRIFTRVPSKWRLVDLETRQIYMVKDGHWVEDKDPTTFGPRGKHSLPQQPAS